MIVCFPAAFLSDVHEFVAAVNCRHPLEVRIPDTLTTKWTKIILLHANYLLKEEADTGNSLRQGFQIQYPGSLLTPKAFHHYY